MPDINKAYSWCIQTCNAPNIGYSQDYRNQQTVGGITYYDCSSLMNYALLNGGFQTPSYAPNYNAFTTYTMPQALLDLGFREVDSHDVWLPGDIALSSGHTEMVYQTVGVGGGICMGAHTSNAPLEYQVSIGSSSGNPDYVSTYSRFPRLFRYGEGGASGYGYSMYVISAIAGNWWQESGINPGIYESLKVVDLKDDNVYGGYGLGQWTNAPQYGTYRRTALAEWLEENGYPYDSPNGQFEFLIYENVWYSTGAAAMYGNLQDFLNSTSTDLYELTGAFLRGWEGIYTTTQHQQRYEYAQRVFNYIQANANNTAIDSWYIGNFYCTDEQKLNNAVMLYRMITAGGGGGGKPSHKRKKKPIWLWLRYY